MLPICADAAAGRPARARTESTSARFFCMGLLREMRGRGPRGEFPVPPTAESTTSLGRGGGPETMPSTSGAAGERLHERDEALDRLDRDGRVERRSHAADRSMDLEADEPERGRL